MATMGKKWVKPIKVKGKNCYNLTDVDNQLQGIEAKEVYTGYRAALNALFFEKTSKLHIPTIGKVEVSQLDTNKLDSIRTLIIGYDCILVIRSSGAVVKMALTNMEDYDSLYAKKMIPILKNVIHECESKVNQAKGKMTPEQINYIASRIPLLATLYRDAALAIEKTAPNEKKVRLNALDFTFLDLKEVIIVEDGFLSLNSDRCKSTLAVKVNTVNNNSNMHIIPDFASTVVKELAEELNREYTYFSQFVTNIDKSRQRYPELSRIACVRGVNLAGLSKLDAKKSITEQLKMLGVTIIREKTILTQREKKNIQEVQEKAAREQKLIKELATTQSQLVEGAKKLVLMAKPLLYYINLGKEYAGRTNLTEYKKWVGKYETDEVAKILDKTMQAECKPFDIKAMITMLYKLEADAEVISLYKYIEAVLPKRYVVSKGKTVTEEALKNLEILKELALNLLDAETVFKELIKGLIGLHYYIFAEFLTKLGCSNIRFAYLYASFVQKSTDPLFVYTIPVLKRVNAMFRLVHNCDDENNVIYDFPKEAFETIRFNSEVNADKVTLEGYISVIDLLFRQYKIYFGF